MRLRVTASGARTLCSAKPIPKDDSLLRDVNQFLSSCQFGDLPPPPAIPPALQYRPPVEQVKALASDIGMDFQAAVDSSNISPIDILSALVRRRFDYSTNLILYRDDPDPSSSLWSFLSTSRPNVRIPTPSLPANNLLYSFHVLSVNLKPSVTQTVLHQWLLTLGSTTIGAFADSIVCPLCGLADQLAGPHRIPRIIKLGGSTLFDFEGGFDRTVGGSIAELSRHYQFASQGCCCHAFVCTGMFAVAVEADDGFPVEIGGKGATPPACWRCCEEPAPICVGRGDEFEFYCPECFEGLRLPDDAFRIDLTRHFITPK
jgi:hypothetical protein